jgi:hypothetical protein
MRPLTVTLEHKLHELEEFVKDVIRVNPGIVDAPVSDQGLANALSGEQVNFGRYVLRFRYMAPAEVVRVHHKQAAKVFMNRAFQFFPPSNRELWASKYPPKSPGSTVLLLDGWLKASVEVP